MSFRLPRFLRRVQPSDLQVYFGARAILFSEQVDWTAKTAALVESVKAAIEALPERERERVFEDFERIDQVSDEIGQRALRSVVEQMKCCSGSFISVTAAKLVAFSCCLQTKKPSNALATAYAERMRPLRYRPA